LQKKTIIRQKTSPQIHQGKIYLKQKQSIIIILPYSKIDPTIKKHAKKQEIQENRFNS